MALALKDRVKETTIVVGTGTATLLGSSIGFQPFSVVGNGNTTYYCISDQFGSNWEVGIGTYSSSGNTLARTTVLASSNAGALVVFTAGVKDVFVTYPAEKGVWYDASGNVLFTGTTTAANLAYTGTLTGSTGILNIGSGQLYKDASGNVGIGTTAGNTKFTVQGATGYGIARFTTSDYVDGVSGSGILIKTGATTGNTYTSIDAYQVGFASSNNLILQSGAGNVGIGTSNPASKLDIGSGNLNFSGTAQRITGDMSNATASNRLMFQTSTTNGNTFLYAIPNGTSQVAAITATNTSTPDNCAWIDISPNATEARIRSGIVGTGSYLPMTFYTSGSEKVRIDTSGNVGIGTSSPSSKLDITWTANAGIRLSDGTVTGVIYNTGGNSMGIGLVTNHPMVLYTNNTEKMRIDSSGNVGIGTSSPAYKLDVVGSANTYFGGRIYNTNSGSTAVSYLQIGNDSNGATAQLGLNSSTNTSNFGGANALYLANGLSAPIVFATTNTERMRIDSSGNLLVGTTSAYSVGTRLNIENGGSGYVVANIKGAVNSNISTLRIERYASDGDGVTFFYGTAQKGYITIASTGTTYNSISDYRLKENVVPMVGALDRVMQLNPVSYVWKDNQKADEGFIAHEVKNIVPSAVAGEKDELDDEGNPRYQGLDQSRIVSVLTAAIQELKAIIDTQQEQINSLLGK